MRSVLFLVLSLSLAHADSTIFQVPKRARTEVVTFERIAQSPVYRQNSDAIQARAEEKVAAMVQGGLITKEEETRIKGWFKELPFQRIVTLRLGFISGLPDLISACLQGNPNQYVSIDACAGSMVFISSISAHVASRFLHYINIKQKEKRDGSISYSGNEVSIGPSVGYRSLTYFDLFGSGGDGKAIDTFLSVEWVYWISRYFGLGLQLDAGTSFIVWRSTENTKPVIPNVKLSLGLSF